MDEFHLSPARMGMFMSYVTFPWIIKPLWGILSDSKPLFNYRRKSYLVIFGITGGISWILIALYGLSNLVVFLGLLFCVSLSVCFTNVVGGLLLLIFCYK